MSYYDDLIRQNAPKYNIADTGRGFCFICDEWGEFGIEHGEFNTWAFCSDCDTPYVADVELVPCLTSDGIEYFGVMVMVMPPAD